MTEQIIVFIVIATTLGLFIDGRIRYEFVALLGLITLSLTGIISPEEVFLGFGHPAVITVASVLIISSALLKSGVIDSLVALLNKGKKGIRFKIMSLMIITAILSGFMNNIGALALIMPIAIRVAKENKASSSAFLMPVAFASLLGGMMTQIGTPPNLIVSSYRVQASGQPFAFFDFAPVGIVLVFVGILFTVAFGNRLIPKRKSDSDDNIFNIEDYLSEVVVTEDSKLAGKNLRELFIAYKLELNILSIVRRQHKIISPSANEQLQVGDILIVRSLSTELTDLINKTGLSLKGAKLYSLDSNFLLKSDNVELSEVVLRDDSFLIGRTALETSLRNRYNVNLVAVSRKGRPSFERLKTWRFKPGDILLIQVPSSLIPDIFTKLRCLPLAERNIDLNIVRDKRKEGLPIIIFTISILLTTFGVLPVQIAFSLAAIFLVLFKSITPREFYEAIEWPSIIMLGSLLPLGSALQSSGGSETIASILSNISTALSPSIMVGVLMVITMILTNLISNTASAALMAPIAFSLAQFMGVSPDPILMCISVASSSAFLTPIGHQSNMLVMGPGGYKFTDFWRLGLPLSILVVLIGTPLILYVWPL